MPKNVKEKKYRKMPLTERRKMPRERCHKRIVRKKSDEKKKGGKTEARNGEKK